jgi:CheY-like chemotaxis protein
MLQRIIGENIQLRIHCPARLPPVLADQVNLEQVIINLVVNARDAMPQGGPLTISAEMAAIDARHQDQQPDALPGTFVQLTVADTGTGMDASVQRKIFEPFFTTKAVGKGTGMGLATVYGIVKQHQGWIEVESAPGAGSKFKVFLPLASGLVEKTTEAGTDFIRAADARPRTILVVEDEDALRGMAATILKRLGHRVLTAANGAEALKLWPLHREQIELLFTDMRMPGGVDGCELAEQLLRDKAALRIIYTTGYSVDFSNPESRLVRSDNCLIKPYDATALIRAVKKAFATATEPPPPANGP